MFLILYITKFHGIFTWNIPKYLQRNVLKNLKFIDKKEMYKTGEWSTFENTTFYCETYAIAFKIQNL